jgi:hypothetical protein
VTKPRVFISYSHHDEGWKNLISKHLHVPERQELIEVWADDSILGGEKWRNQILQAIDSAQVAILLVSADFLGSEFILQTEIPLIIEKFHAGRLKVLPVLVRPCLWASVPWLVELQVRPWNGVSLSAHRGHRLDMALMTIAEEVLKLIRPVTLV